MRVKLLQITDLHLSDRADTPAAEALRWAIDTANTLVPDLVAFTGDMTTHGTAESATRFLERAEGLTVPWVFTPGNAELRSDGAMSVLAECVLRQSIDVGGIRFLLPDTSTGRFTPKDRAWMDAVDRSEDCPIVLLTHYPTDTLDVDSREWVTAWLAGRPVELYLAGHRHFTRSRSVGGCQEVITRGLDPDKAFGGPPGISVFERGDGRWIEEAIAWPHGNDLLPADTDHSPVGWSIHGDPTDAVVETYDFGLNVLELRPREPDYDFDTTLSELSRLREDRPLYLSWHLPSLNWDDETHAVRGGDDISRQVEHGRQCGVDAFTIHVPQARADRMFDGDEPSGVWTAFLEYYDRLFRDAVTDGIRLSIENVHNAPGTPRDRAERKFATEIGEYLAWIDSVRSEIGSIACVGAHFDVGHARNNGDFGNIQPLGDWYSRVGSLVTGYHIHQVRPHEDTGKLTNHRDIISLYDRTISYAGFLYAWSNRLINRAPLFVEVRDPEERRRTTRLLERHFAEG